MQEQVSTAYNLQGQAPLDAKNITQSLQTLFQKIDNDSSIFLSFYKGLEIYVQSESEKIVWEEVTESNIHNGILEDNYTYPSNVIYEGFDYSGKEFNFFYTGNFGNLSGDYGPENLEQKLNDQNYL